MQRLPNTPEGETKPIGFRLPPPTLAMIDREVAALRAGVPEAAAGGITRSTALRALLVELEQRRAADPATPANAPPLALPRVTLERIVAALEGAGADLRGLLEGGAPVAPARPLSPAVLAQRARSVLIAAELEAEIERARALPAKMAAEDAYVAQLRAREQLREEAVTHTAAGGQLSLLTRTANDGAQGPAQPSEPPHARRVFDTSTAPAEVLAALRPRLEAAMNAGHTVRALAREAGIDAASVSRWLNGTRGGMSLATARKLGEALARLGF